MSGDILQQDEVDALLGGVGSGAVDTEPRPIEDPGIARTYDFATQARIVRGRMQTLDAINERLARSLRHSIYKMLRRSPDINVASVETAKYGDYIPTLSIPTSLNTIRFAPLAGTALLTFDAKLISSLIDVYFGGNGRPATIEDRDFSPAELQIVQMLLDQVVIGICEAWAPVLAVNVELVAREMNPHFVNLVRPTDIVVISRLRIDIEDKGGDIHLVYPYAMLEPLKDTLRAGIQTGATDPGGDWSRTLRNELEESEVDLVTILGHAQLSVGSLLDMTPGDILPCSFDGRATVLADGIPLFWGELGQQRGRQVVKISTMSARKAGNSLDAFMKGAT
jgi:flagellar motor switch protein FliM